MPLMRATVAAALLALAVALPSAQSSSTPSVRLDQRLKAAVDRGDVPGVVAMAADRNGIIYSGAFGLQDAGHRRPLGTDTVFRIASMTKAVTSVAAMQLVEQEKLALDEPISKVLPELASPRVLEGFDAAGAPQFRPATRISPTG